MQSNKDPESSETQPEQETKKVGAPTYNCDSSCRYVDGNGLVCGFCMKKVLGEYADQK